MLEHGLVLHFSLLWPKFVLQQEILEKLARKPFFFSLASQGFRSICFLSVSIAIEKTNS